MSRFCLDRFLADCAQAPGSRLRAVRRLLKTAIADPDAIEACFAGEEAEEKLLCRAPNLTIVHVRLSPNVRFPPHDHAMLSLIGSYRGHELHRFFRRESRVLRSSGEAYLREGDVLVLPPNAIHSVANPSRIRTAAIHIYLGDLVGTPRSIWNPDTSARVPYSDFDYFRWCRPEDPDRPFERPALCDAHAQVNSAQSAGTNGEDA